MLDKIMLLLVTLGLIWTFGLVIECLIIKEYEISIYALLISSYFFVMVQILFIKVFGRMKIMDDKQYYDEKLAEIPKEFLDKVVNFVQEDFGKDPEMIEEIKAAYEEKGPIQWAIPAHHDWGMHIRNVFRGQGFTDDNLPDGNWDDYYIQVIELALELR